MVCPSSGPFDYSVQRIDPFFIYLPSGNLRFSRFVGIDKTVPVHHVMVLNQAWIQMEVSCVKESCKSPQNVQYAVTISRE